MEKHISTVQIVFSLFLSQSECSLSVINLNLTAAQFCERDFSAVGTFFALSIFAEKALYLLCRQIRLRIESHYRFYPLHKLDTVLVFGTSGDFQCKFII